jgi:hypothetical protein
VVDEVRLQPVVATAPAPATTPQLRVLLVLLATAVSALGVLVVGLVLRLRRYGQAMAPAKPNAITRPMTPTGAPRKVA